MRQLWHAQRRRVCQWARFWFLHFNDFACAVGSAQTPEPRRKSNAKRSIKSQPLISSVLRAGKSAAPELSVDKHVGGKQLIDAASDAEQDPVDEPSPAPSAKMRMSMGNAPDIITERDSERQVGDVVTLIDDNEVSFPQALTAFFERTALGSGKGSIYVSGKPGTGKTALLTEILAVVRPRLASHVSLVTINCMTLATPAAVFQVHHSVNLQYFLIE